MPTPSTALYAILSGAAGVAAIAGDRIYPGVVPQQDAWPALSFVRLDEDQESAMGADTSAQETAFEITATAADYDTAEALHEAVRAACRRSRGPLGGLQVDDILLQGGEGPILFDDPAGYEASQRIVMRYQSA